jgi:glucosamine-6-phosphate deaminase
MHVNGLTVRTFDSPAAAARTLARHVAHALTLDPALVLGLPTGRTPVLLYAELASLCAGGRADFSQATTFNLDEFLGVSSEDPRSYRAFMQRHLFEHVNLSPRRINFLDGTPDNAEAECLRYETRIARAGGLDLLILGLGVNGHIGFNEPARALTAATHRTRLTAATRRANVGLFEHRLRDVPREALSMGMGTILRANRIVLLATGASKARTVKRLVCGPISPAVPASFLQLHRAVEVWVDAAAGAALSANGK